MLTATEIHVLNARFGSRVARLWCDIELLARRLHQADAVDERMARHHLLLAVVNVKARLWIDPPALAGGANQSTVVERARVANLDRDDSDTWKAFQQSTRGFLVPRTSTLLAALWPAHHAVVDWRSLASAFALACDAEAWRTPMPDGSSADPMGSPSWERYAWYRGRVLADAAELGLGPVKIERALFLLAKDVQSGPNRTWDEYARAVNEAPGPAGLLTTRPLHLGSGPAHDASLRRNRDAHGPGLLPPHRGFVFSKDSAAPGRSPSRPRPARHRRELRGHGASGLLK
jgi:hypothetical protein